MPEFILDHGSLEGSKAFAELDSFTQGYIEAMFFTNTGTGDDGDLEDATVSDLAPETLERIKRDCREFQAGAAGAILFKIYESDTNYSPEQAGRDFWYTRCGHGVGFWDRGLGIAGDLLSDYAHAFSSRDLYRGDDGLLYLM